MATEKREESSGSGSSAGAGAGSRRSTTISVENPLLAHLVFVKMEDIMDKLKLLDYENEFCKKFKIKPFSK